MMQMARLVSAEGAQLVERQTYALFGNLKQLQRQMQVCCWLAQLVSAEFEGAAAARTVQGPLQSGKMLVIMVTMVVMGMPCWSLWQLLRLTLAFGHEHFLCS